MTNQPPRWRAFSKPPFKTKISLKSPWKPARCARWGRLPKRCLRSVGSTGEICNRSLRSLKSLASFQLDNVRNFRTKKTPLTRGFFNSEHRKLFYQKSRLTLYIFQVIHQTQFSANYYVLAVDQVVVAVKNLHVDRSVAGGRHQVFAILQFRDVNSLCH